MQTIEISQKASRTGRRSVLQTSADRKHVRARRRFRLNYPDEVVECAVLLSCLLGVRAAALALDLRLSTLYRWFNKHRTRRSQFVVQLVEGQNVQAADAPRSMIVRCADKSVTSHPYILNQLRGTSEQTSTATVENENALAEQESTIVPRMDAHVDAVPGIAHDSKTTANHRTPSERILSTKTLIDSQYSEDWSCEKLARLVGISKFQFINEFSAAFGQSPYHYLLGVRVRHAIELVRRRSDRTLAEIARSVGFGSSSSMRRAFKNFLGASPANFVNGSALSLELRPGLANSGRQAGQSDTSRSLAIGARSRHASERQVATEHHGVGI